MTKMIFVLWCLKAKLQKHCSKTLISIVKAPAPTLTVRGGFTFRSQRRSNEKKCFGKYNYWDYFIGGLWAKTYAHLNCYTYAYGYGNAHIHAYGYTDADAHIHAYKYTYAYPEGGYRDN